MRSVQINDIPKYDYRLLDLILSTHKPNKPRSDEELDREFDKDLGVYSYPRYKKKS